MTAKYGPRQGTGPTKSTKALVLHRLGRAAMDVAPAMGSRHVASGGAAKRAGGARVAFVSNDGRTLTPPGKVLGVPEIIHVGSDYVEILWAPPASVGTAPMSGYELAARVGGVGEFDTLLVTDDPRTSASVPVAPNVWLEFTVTAQSEAGPGPPSRPSMPVLTRKKRRGRRRGGGESKSRGGNGRRRGSGSGKPQLLDDDDEVVSDFDDADDEGDASAVLPLRQPRNGPFHAASHPPGGGASSSVTKAASDDSAFAALAEVLGAADAGRYHLLRAELSDIETVLAERLGRTPSDEELASNPAYRELALEYAGLRARRERALATADTRGRANREWQELLEALGFDVSARLIQLELDKSRWHMDFSRRSRGHAATVHDQLQDKSYAAHTACLVATWPCPPHHTSLGYVSIPSPPDFPWPRVHALPTTHPLVTRGRYVMLQEAIRGEAANVSRSLGHVACPPHHTALGATCQVKQRMSAVPDEPSTRVYLLVSSTRSSRSLSRRVMSQPR